MTKQPRDLHAGFMKSEISQRGTAVTDCPARDNCASCTNTAVSRQGEQGDFVAHGETGFESVAEQFENKIRERSADLRFLRRFPSIVPNRT